MKKLFPLLLLFIACNQQPEANRPNILLIVADDLGYTDLGCYGSEIRTPNLDALALRGIRNTSFCTAPTCSPTRSMLLTGVDNHRAGLGTMNGDWAPNQEGQPGYEGYLNQQVVTLPRLMQDAGYHTAMAGKWHLGSADGQRPLQRGFTRSYGLIPGGGGHFADMQPLVEAQGEKVYYAEDDQTLDTLPSGFYTSAAYAAKMIQYIDESQQLEKPFLGFLAFTSPHWPLQVPDAYIDLYKGQYDAGYEALAKARFQRAKEMGAIPPNAQQPPLAPNVMPWDSLSDEEKQVEARTMEIYAAMVERMDFHIGQVIDHLKKIGEFDNTLIIFHSDNGAEGNSIMGYDGTGEWVDTTFDNSLENMGRPNSYVQQGPGWGHVSALPFSWYKAFSTEGGVRVPAIIAYPKWPLPAGTWNHDFLSIMDIAPTVLEMADIIHPDTVYEGRTIFPMNGVSMLAWLEGKAEWVHSPDAAHGWELFGRRGLRKGDWKLEWMEDPYGHSEWELYNLKEDIAEQNNLAGEYTDKLEELITDWEAYIKSVDLIIPSEPTAYGSEEVWRKD